MPVLIVLNFPSHVSGTAPLTSRLGCFGSYPGIGSAETNPKPTSSQLTRLLALPMRSNVEMIPVE